jgi:hypothetical protein
MMVALATSSSPAQDCGNCWRHWLAELRLKAEGSSPAPTAPAITPKDGSYRSGPE